jgi:hypothetical protein
LSLSRCLEPPQLGLHARKPLGRGVDLGAPGRGVELALGGLELVGPVGDLKHGGIVGERGRRRSEPRPYLTSMYPFLTL